MSNDFAFNEPAPGAAAGSDGPRPPRPAAGSPFRFVSPAVFAAAVGVFFLPWIDLGCSSPKGREQLIVQTGYQVATGAYTEGEFITQAKAAGGDRGNGAMMKEFGGGSDGDSPDAAPVLWGYLGLLAAGVVVPFVVKGARPRGAAVAAVAVLALLVAGGSAAVGFPLARKGAELNAKMAEKSEREGRARGGDTEKDRAAAMMAAAFLPRFQSDLLLGFWLSVLVLVCAGVMGLLEVATAPKPRPTAWDSPGGGPG